MLRLAKFNLESVKEYVEGTKTSNIQFNLTRLCHDSCIRKTRAITPRRLTERSAAPPTWSLRPVSCRLTRSSLSDAVVVGRAACGGGRRSVALGRERSPAILLGRVCKLGLTEYTGQHDTETRTV